jgi:hypothetical protein
VDADELLIHPLTQIIRLYLNDKGHYKYGRPDGLLNLLTIQDLAGLLPTESATTALGDLIINRITSTCGYSTALPLTISDTRGLFVALDNPRAFVVDQAIRKIQLQGRDSGTITCIVLGGCQQYHWLGAFAIWLPGTDV